MIGAGNVLKKHAADNARRSAVTDEEAPEDDDLELCSRISFESAHSQCMENCGVLTLTVVCQGAEMNQSFIWFHSSTFKADVDAVLCKEDERVERKQMHN